MKTAYKYRTDWKKSYAGKRKAREKSQLGKRTYCMWTNRPITAWKTKNWGSLALRAGNVTARRRGPRAATCCAAGAGTTPTSCGTWSAASASSSGAATCAAGGARPWPTCTPASEVECRKHGQSSQPVCSTQLPCRGGSSHCHHAGFQRDLPWGNRYCHTTGSPSEPRLKGQLSKHQAACRGSLNTKKDSWWHVWTVTPWAETDAKLLKYLKDTMSWRSVCGE